jgi:hypothetical protein
LRGLGPDNMGARGLPPAGGRESANVSQMKLASVVAFATMVVALFVLWLADSLARSPGAIALQVGAVALMIWARATFGLRSFHATASPSQGDLITTGPLPLSASPDPCVDLPLRLGWSSGPFIGSFYLVRRARHRRSGRAPDLRRAFPPPALSGLMRIHAQDKTAFARLVLKSPE